MSYFFAAYALCVNFALWGGGLALWVLPRKWRRCWPGVAPAFGVALQSAVVWVGAHTGLRGTDSYGVWTVLAPVLLLGFAVRKTGIRQVMRDLFRWRAVGAIMAGSLVLLTLPLAWRADNLTTTSLGSCDAADYAAGARVFKEFTRGDRDGFLGLTEVVSVGSTDNFFDFWLKLNHFTPSALIALNGSLSGKAPYELTGILTVVLLVLVIPVVYLVARSVFPFRPVPALWLGFIFGLSPINWYAAYHVAPAQLIAAMGIGLVTWLAWLLWRERSRRETWRYFASLAVVFSLLWGAYNFIIVVCLVPAGAIVAGCVWTEKRWADFSWWVFRLLLPMLAAGGFYFERVAGLVERFFAF